MNTYETVILDRIRELRTWFRWYRRQPNPAHWADLAEDTKYEIKSLIAIIRKARRIEAAQPDPMTAYKSFADWTQGELRLAWGDR